MNTKSTYFAPIVTVISTSIAILIGLRTIQKTNRKMWLSNMIGGIIFSQSQTTFNFIQQKSSTSKVTG